MSPLLYDFMTMISMIAIATLLVLLTRPVFGIAMIIVRHIKSFFSNRINANLHETGYNVYAVKETTWRRKLTKEPARTSRRRIM